MAKEGKQVAALMHRIDVLLARSRPATLHLTKKQAQTLERHIFYDAYGRKIETPSYKGIPVTII